MNASLLKYLDDLKGFPSFENFEEVTVRTQNLCGDTALHYAAVQGNLEIVRLLVSEGADLNQRGEFGYTPLAVAVSLKHVEIVGELIAAGADLKVKIDCGLDILQIAAVVGDSTYVTTIDSIIRSRTMR